MLNVMIVEDDLTISDLLQEALEADGYHVVGVARTVRQAVELTKQHCPDLAVVDIRLANGELGTDVATRLRATTNTKIMFSTGNSNDLKLLETCGDAVMTKPYSLTDIGRGLKIIDQMARLGRTDLPFPRNFRLLSPVVA